MSSEENYIVGDEITAMLFANKIMIQNGKVYKWYSISK